jgi:hypothetical protein
MENPSLIGSSEESLKLNLIPPLPVMVPFELETNASEMTVKLDVSRLPPELSSRLQRMVKDFGTCTDGPYSAKKLQFVISNGFDVTTVKMVGGASLNTTTRGH